MRGCTPSRTQRQTSVDFIPVHRKPTLLQFTNYIKKYVLVILPVWSHSFLPKGHMSIAHSRSPAVTSAVHGSLSSPGQDQLHDHQGHVHFWVLQQHGKSRGRTVQVAPGEQRHSLLRSVRLWCIAVVRVLLFLSFLSVSQVSTWMSSLIQCKVMESFSFCRYLTSSTKLTVFFFSRNQWTM